MAIFPAGTWASLLGGYQPADHTCVETIYVGYLGAALLVSVVGGLEQLTRPFEIVCSGGLQGEEARVLRFLEQRLSEVA